MSNLYEKEFNHYVRIHEKLGMDQIGFCLHEYLRVFGWSNDSIEKLARVLLDYVEHERILDRKEAP